MEHVAVAALDIGTNSVKVVVGASDGRGVRILAEDMVITRLGDRLDATGLLGEEAQSRTIKGMGSLLDRIRELGADTIRVVATSAVRDASNRSEFIAAVKSQLGLDVDVLSEEDEGRLSYAAVALDPTLSLSKRRGGNPDTLAIVDIGGGSTELAFGCNSSPDFAKSVRIGAVRLTERFIRSDPPTDAELVALADAADDAMCRQIGERTCDKLVGVGGSVVNLARVHAGVLPAQTEAVHGLRLSRQEISIVLHRLRRMTVEERMQVTGIDPERADTIIAGIIILERAMALLGEEEVVVSTHGLRHGLLYEMLLRC